MTVDSGVKTALLTVWDCAQPNQAPTAWARADHGTISITQTKAQSCGLPSMNVTAVFYQSARGYKGKDTVYLLGYLTQANINRTIIVLVK